MENELAATRSSPSAEPAGDIADTTARRLPPISGGARRGRWASNAPRLFPRFLRVRLFKLPAAVVVSGLVRSTFLLSTFALSTLVVGHAMAQTPEAARVANTAAQSAELSPAQANAAQLVDAFVGALVAEQFDAARQFMTPGAVVVANGVVLGERDGYIDGAAHKDAAALRTVQRDLLRREVSAGDDFAYVVSEKQMRVPGDASGRSERVIETVLMARTQAGWKITHIHWSGRHAG